MSAFPAGYARVVLERVDSTLDEARRRLPEVTGPTWIMARHQTAARGRRGRAWVMPEGNFAATLVLPERDPGRGALRSFVVAVALREACIAVTGRSECFSLKWPNDVLMRGGKLAGILLESLSTGGAMSHVALGIGVNLSQAPDAGDLEEGAVAPEALARLGIVPSPDAFLDALAESYARLEDQFSTYGFEPIRRAWLAEAARLGETITARTTQASVTGTFVDVDAAGQLVLETPKGRLAIAAADVYF